MERGVEKARDDVKRQVDVLRAKGNVIGAVEDPAGGPIRWRLFREGMLVPPGTQGHASLPDDMTIVITRTGKTPAKIEVRKGEQTWMVAEDELDKLPEDVRGAVQGMLGRAVVVAIAPEGAQPRVREARPMTGPVPAPAARRMVSEVDRRIERDLGEVERPVAECP